MSSNAVARRLQLFTLAVCVLGAALAADTVSRLGADSGIPVMTPRRLVAATGVACLPLGLIAAAALARWFPAEMAFACSLLVAAVAFGGWRVAAPNNWERLMVILICAFLQWCCVIVAIPERGPKAQ